MFRKTVFWIHLIAGIATGFVVITMSVTGVILTYERQMLAWGKQQHFVPASEQTAILSVDQLIRNRQQEEPDFSPTSITILNKSGAPISMGAGPLGGIELNPYTGEEMHTETPQLEQFFRTMTSFHRWFNVQGEGRNTARAITGASNLIFLFLIVSGLYLWLPNVYKWVMFKTRLTFNAKATTSKARDYNWHHVFGFWTAIPLAIVIATATVFSYGWANNLVYQAFGEQAPVRGRGPGAPPQGESQTETPVIIPLANAMSNNDLLYLLANSSDDWRQIRATIPAPYATDMVFNIDYGNGAQPQLQETLTLDRISGEVIGRTGFDSQSAGQRARIIVRYLHTGEVLGFWGQTIAGVVSLLSLLMVWTGFALAWRRLISPLFARRR